MAEKPRILLVDDNELLINEIQSKLRYEGFEVETANNGIEGLQKIVSFQPYVVILDIDMPVMNGRDMLRQLRLSDKITRVIVLTDYGEHKSRTLRDQANLFLSKPYDLDELINYLQNFVEDYLLMRKAIGGLITVEGMQALSKNNVLVRGQLSYDSGSGRVRLGGEELTELSPTEKKLLIFFMQNPDRLFSVEDLVEKVLGYDYDGGSNNIRNVISRLRRVLGDSPKRSIYIENVRDEGYRFSKHPHS